MFMHRVGGVAFGLLVSVSLTVGGAWADGLPERAHSEYVPFSWAGFYVGYHTGGALDRSNIADPYGTPIFGDKVRSPGLFTGGQIGFNKQIGGTVIGLETDVSWAGLDGTNTCLEPGHTSPSFVPTFIGNSFGATCRVRTNWFGTATGRLGLAVGPQGRTLIYGKGGLAWVDKDVDMAINNVVAGAAGPPNATSSSSFSQLGWTVGGGVEYALTGNWSAKLEYDFLSFGNHDVSTPDAGAFALPGFPGILGSTAPDGRTAGLSQDLHTFKLGVNYRFGDRAAPSQADWPAGSIKDAPARGATGYEFEGGARYVGGWSRFQKDFHVGGPQPASAARLTWHEQTNGGELFARIDTPHNVMIKGLAGLGSGDGHMNDEDWGLPIGNPPVGVQPYSNTLSDAENRIRYWTIDAGYDWLRGPGYKLASFVGYNYYRNNMNAFGCTKIVFTPSIPCNAVNIPPSFLLLQEQDKWQSLRLGAAGDFMLAHGLKLSGEVAYLPYTRFKGLDVHTIGITGTGSHGPETGNGRGVQLEGVLSYDFTKNLSLGVGARYWAMWVPANGDVVGITALGTTPPISGQRYAAEQTAVFLQGSYKFGADW